MTSFKKVRTLVIIALVFEFLSPVPLFFSFGAVYILFNKPQWFFDFVTSLYKQSGNVSKQKRV